MLNDKNNVFLTTKENFNLWTLKREKDFYKNFVLSFGLRPHLSFKKEKNTEKIKTKIYIIKKIQKILISIEIF